MPSPRTSSSSGSVWIGLGILGILLAGSFFYFRRENQHAPVLPPGASKAVREKVTPTPPVSSRPSPTPALAGRPRVILIIDDFGYVNADLIEAFCRLPIPFAGAVLPYQPESQLSAERLHQNQKEVMLHLPMEGRASANPGPDALLDSLGEQEMIQRTRKALQAVPYIVGSNNHMGSVVTSNRVKMKWILREIKARRLFFIDSRTASTTVAAEVAEELQIPQASRNVFLDDEKDFKAIETQWKRGLRIAQQEGQVVMIGHVYPETLRALQRLIPSATKEVRFVLPSEVLLKR